MPGSPSSSCFQLALLWLCAIAGQSACVAGKASPPAGSYDARRAHHRTRLTLNAPSPNAYASPRPPPGVRELRYPSAGRQLKAWLVPPTGAGPHPAVVYLHGNFELPPQVFTDVAPLADAGFAVFVPTYRGEQGNPGRFELLYGEVEDAAAAVRWLARQPGIDATRIWAIGHSVGGGIAAMLSLICDLPLRSTASVGGIYVPETFQRWTRMRGNRRLVRFDVRDRQEVELRVPGPHVHAMRRPHVAYVGLEDPGFIDNARRVRDRAADHQQPFEVEYVPGDHMGSLAPALTAFARRLARESP